MASKSANKVARGKCAPPDHLVPKIHTRGSGRVRIRETTVEGADHGDALTPGSSPRALLTLRAAFILVTASIASTMSATLTYLATASLPAAFLAAGPSFAAAVPLLNSIIS